MSLRSLAAWKKPLVAFLMLATLFVNFGSAQYASAQRRDFEGVPVGSLDEDGRPTAGAASVAESGIPATESEAISTSDACSGGSTIEGQFLGFLCTGITRILGWIVELLGKLVLLIISVLLAFARYNGFSNTEVVRVGWPIVRDICNMFFIVILLVSAFSTIIDYGGGELHYTKVLPKLLLMAVLINFSKTLIQLLIDFSQVVMLTFVNAFIASGTGNFVNALGLQDVMQIAENGVPTGAATMANVIISYMLAIFMLGIMVSVVSILTGFIIFRIVGLWIALILSPLAFFATAVPGKLAKGLGSISSDYWTRLGSLLSGGPIIAFFLWLTLAVVQQANSGAAGAGLSQVLDFEVEGDLQVFLTSVGNAQSIASFIVGITLLLMGMDQAVKSANSIGSTFLSTFAQRAKGAGMSLGRLGALAPFLAAGYGAKAGAAGLRAGYRAADQRLDLTRQISTKGLAATNYLANGPVLGALGGRALRSAVRPTLAKGLTMRREEAAKEAKEQADLMSKIDKVGTDEELKLVSSTYSMSDSAFRTLGARAGSMKVAEILATDKIRDREIKKNEGSYVKDLQKSGMSEADAKSGSKVLAEKDAYREQMGFIQDQLRLAKSLGDKDKEEELLKAIRQNPYMAADADRKSEIEKLATDADKYKDINKQDSLSGDLLTGFMLKHGWDTDKNTGELKVKDGAAYNRLKESVEKSGNKNLLEGLKAHESFVLNSPGLKTTDASTLQHRKNAADGMMQTFDVSKDASGAWARSSAGTLQAGNRVHTSNYKNALNELEASRVQRVAAGDTKPRDVTLQGNADNAKLANNFIDNNGTLADYLSVAKSSDVDNVPIQTIQGEVFTQMEKGVQQLIAGNTTDANASLKLTGKVFNQIDQQGISDEVQTQLIQAASTGMRTTDGRIQAEFIRNIDRLTPQIRNSMIKLVETAKKRADDILQLVAKDKMTEAQKEVVDFADAISKEIDKNKKNINSRILNSYRPGRDRNG